MTPNANPFHSQVGFAAHERQLLLRQPLIGPGVIRRLEHVGISSLQQLAACGVDAVVEQICQSDGNLAFRNRQAALRRALQTGTAWQTTP